MNFTSIFALFVMFYASKNFIKRLNKNIFKPEFSNMVANKRHLSDNKYKISAQHLQKLCLQGKQNTGTWGMNSLP